jgi:AbrB family looped-hinge helix DNA binding protein
MPKVRLNYDGWLALPAAARRALGVDTGDQLEVEVVDGRIVLRPLKPSAAAGSPADKELPPAAAEPEPTAAMPSSEVKRGPGRPRKATGAPSAGTVLPPHLKARGAKRKAAASGETPR